MSNNTGQQLVLETEHLALRLPNQKDAPAISLLADNIKIARMVARVKTPYTLADAEQWLAQTEANHESLLHITFVICLRYQNRVIGTIGAAHLKQQSYGLGYWVGEDYWGQGYATEAVQAMIDFLAKKREAKYINAWYADDNPASRRVLEKCGLAFRGKQGPVHSVGRGCDVPCSLMEMDVKRI